MKKALIIRFSSLGDLAHVMPATAAIKKHHPQCSVHWLTKSEFTPIVESNKNVDNVISFNKNTGLVGLVQLAFKIKNKKYSHIYDAHNNLRSNILLMILRIIHPGVAYAQRSKFRFKRFLLFRLRINKFPIPYRAADTFVSPIARWLSSSAKPETVATNATPLKMQLPENYITISPSAAWPKKRWPLSHWKNFLKLSPVNIVILGGPGDEFCEELALERPEIATNLAGKLSWTETLEVIKHSTLLVSGDTGTLHLADMINHPNIGLIGPTAFGYTWQKNSIVIEKNMPCKPCDKDGRGKCSNKTYQKCLVDISAEEVWDKISKETLLLKNEIKK